MKVKLVILLIFLLVSNINFAQHRSLDLRPGYTWQQAHTIAFDLGI